MNLQLMFIPELFTVVKFIMTDRSVQFFHDKSGKSMPVIQLYIDSNFLNSPPLDMYAIDLMKSRCSYASRDSLGCNAATWHDTAFWSFLTQRVCNNKKNRKCSWSSVSLLDCAIFSIVWNKSDFVWDKVNQQVDNLWI